MPTRNRTQLRGANGEVIGDIEPPPSRITDFLPQWIRWLFNLYEYFGLINENFLTVEDWNNVSFDNSWGNTVGYSTNYYIDPFGRVHLRGRITGGATGNSAFTLPTGYRPEYESVAVVNIAGGINVGAVVIGTNGTVTPYFTTGTDLYLDNISFRI